MNEQLLELSIMFEEIDAFSKVIGSLYLKSLNKKNRASHAKYDFRVFFSKSVDLVQNLRHFEIFFQSAKFFKVRCNRATKFRHMPRDHGH